MIATYIHVAKLGIRNKLEYRFNTLMGLLSRLIFFVALYSLWQVIYQTRTQVVGYSFDEMISYTLLAVLVSSLVETNIGARAHRQVKNGEISSFIIRPMSFMLYHLSFSFGIFLFELVIASLIFITLILFFPSIHFILTPLRITTFLLALIVANLIYTQLYLCVGILAFWLKEGSFLIQFVKKFVKFLAGGYIPITLFPFLLQKILVYLPFAATIYFPTIVLTDKKLTNMDLLRTIMLQAFWLVMLFLMNKLLWNKGIRKYESVGI